MKETIITSSILILCIVLLRQLCRRKISAKLQYMLWLVVAVRLVIPGVTVLWPNLLPESAYSVLNVADQVERAAQEYMRPPEQPVQGILPSEGLPFLTEERADGRVVTYLIDQAVWLKFWRKIWYMGMAAVGCWMTAVNIRFMKRLYGCRRKYEREDSKLPVYTVKGLTSPCLYGWPGRQAVYLPEDVAEDEKKMRHILAHEYCHYRQKDILWSVLRCVLLIIYWFHPLVWLAAVLSKQDCELACDEAALRMLGEEERIAYGKTLVSLITRKTSAADIVCTATTMTTAPKRIKERVQRIVESPRRLVFLIAPVLAVIAAVIVLTFTQAKNIPEGAYLLEEEGSLIVTTSCFQVTFPESFAGKAYYRKENDTDIIVHHKDSGLEVGRFCMMNYEEAVQLASESGIEFTLVGNYGANDSWNRFMEEPERDAETSYHTYMTNDAENAGDTGYAEGTERIEQGNNAEDMGSSEQGNDVESAENIESENGIVGVPGTDSNEITIYYSPEVETADETAAWEASGGVETIPAPELVKKDVINLPYKENEDYSAVTVEDETEYLIVDDTAQEEVNHFYDSKEEDIQAVEDSSVYLPNEQITEVYMPGTLPCYLYIPADYSEADSGTREELFQMNQSLEELADSVIVLYVSREAMEETLNTLVKNRTAYVGDNVRVSQIAGSLPAASGMSYQYLELKTTTEPYAVTLYYRIQADNAAQTDSKISFLGAVLMFSSIENLERCNIQIYDVSGEDGEVHSDPAQMQYEVISYSRKEMEEIFGALYPYSETKETITDLYNLVLEYLENEDISAAK